MDSKTPFLPYPWLQDIFKQLLQAHTDGRMPHALLLSGIRGVGKHALAESLAASLLCSEVDDDGQPCGGCRGCQLHLADTHPDLHRIAPEEKGKAIKIDAIREFTEQEGLTSHSGGYKIVLIEPADAMTNEAANSLLKTLEEPVAWTLIILITSKPGNLPATIRSRCQQIVLSAPSKDIALNWLQQQIGSNGSSESLLQFASGAPIRAVELADQEMQQQRLEMLDEFIGLIENREGPIEVAGRWEKLDPDLFLQWLSGWVIDMLRLKMVVDPPNLINLEQTDRLQAVAGKLDLRKLYTLLDRLYEVHRAIDSTLNLRLLLEGLLLQLTVARQTS
jgi:DNA polymerase-3 subunit delta'